MVTGAHDIQIKQVRGHWEVYINGEFFCTADSYDEAVNEVYKKLRSKTKGE